MGEPISAKSRSPRVRPHLDQGKQAREEAPLGEAAVMRD